MIFETQEGYKIKRIGRCKKLYWSLNGRCFFRWNNRRYYLDEIMRLSYPLFFYRNDRTFLDYCGGYITLSNCYGVLICLNDSCETIEIFEEMESECE